ncbi:MAG: DMT family transporter [Chloroflexi bacterium]|nr:DMT family transporter [Chloroflexota bacterium]
MKIKEWAAFGMLGLVWGSSFLWIKIAVQEVGPFTLVAFRLLFGVLGLLVIMRWQRQSFPRDRRTLLAYLFMGVVNTAVPFVLISWGETKIDSGLASILNGTVPLFTIVIAHYWLHDEKITVGRLAGLAVGFVGVVVLVSRDFGPQGLHGNLWGQLAVIAASICYATAITFSRRHLRNQPPVVQSFMVLLLADAVIWPATLMVDRPFHLPQLPVTWLALAWLGLLGSCFAYLMFFYLINAWGPARASLVTYVFPVIGVILGIIFLKEVADWRLMVGTLLIVGAVLAVNNPFAAKPALAVSAAD